MQRHCKWGHYFLDVEKVMGNGMDYAVTKTTNVNIRICKIYMFETELNK